MIKRILALFFSAIIVGCSSREVTPDYEIISKNETFKEIGFDISITERIDSIGITDISTALKTTVESDKAVLIKFYLPENLDKKSPFYASVFYPNSGHSGSAKNTDYNGDKFNIHFNQNTVSEVSNIIDFKIDTPKNTSLLGRFPFMKDAVLNVFIDNERKNIIHYINWSDGSVSDKENAKAIVEGDGFKFYGIENSYWIVQDKTLSYYHSNGSLSYKVKSD